MDLSKLTKLTSKENKSKRVGRGIGSGKGGHTVGKGQKGQKSREGKKFPLGFEGGQVPLFKRLPRVRGYSNPSYKSAISIVLSRLNAFEDGKEISPAILVSSGFLKRLPKKTSVKLIAGRSLNKKLILTGFLFSEKALQDAKKSGSKINA
jgi:large subunit ribosomal protein L15